MALRIVRTFSLALPLAALSACSPDGGSGPCDVSRDTAAYTWTAADPSALFRWTSIPGKPEDVRIYADVDDRPGHVPAGFDPAAAMQHYENARTRWRQALAASGLSIESFTQWLASEDPNPEGYAKMLVEYVDTIPSPPTAVGLTSVTFVGNRVDRVRIQLALRRQSGEPLTAEELRAIALHEYGHALGFLDGHSPNGADVMHAESTCNWSTLSTGDDASIVELYHTSPDLLGEGYLPD